MNEDMKEACFGALLTNNPTNNIHGFVQVNSGEMDR
jgi:hypothetical protein